MAAVAPDLIQLHGNESPARAAAIAARTGRPVIKALAVADGEDVVRAHAYEDAADYLLFDAKADASATRPGGWGAAFDWQLVSGRTFKRPFGVAGGLDAGECRARHPGLGRAARRCLLRRGGRAGLQEPGQDRGLRRRGAQRSVHEHCRRGMTDARPNSFALGPDAGGHFGDYGGRFVAETLMPLMLHLEQAYDAAKDDPAFHAELNGLLKHYVGRQTRSISPSA